MCFLYRLIFDVAHKILKVDVPVALLVTPIKN